MAVQLDTLSDESLLVQAFNLGDVLGYGGFPDSEIEAVNLQYMEAIAEMDRRWGPDSMDLLATYFTATKASHADMVWWAQERTEVLVEIAKDIHQCKLEPSGRYGEARCRCGAIAVR